MTTDEKKVIEPLSSEWIAYVISTRTEEGAINVISMAADRLRQERDDLVRALGLVIRSCDAGYCGDAYMEISPKTIDIARKVLSKHKPQ